MKILSFDKPTNPRFSCGPTKKPDGWSLNKINKQYLGRYHRAGDIKTFIEEQLFRIKKFLRFQNPMKYFLCQAHVQEQWKQ